MYILLFTDDDIYTANELENNIVKNNNIKLLDICYTKNEIFNKLNYSNSKSEIINTLNSFGFNTSASGTKYLIDCILLCLEKPNYFKNLSKFVYPIIAQQHSTDTNKVVWNINRSIKSMWRYTPDTQKTSIFFNLDSIRKPNIKNIISAFVDK